MTTEYELALQEGRKVAILEMQRAIIDSGRDLGPASCPVEHLFAPGVYSRTITMERGMQVIGKMHKHAHVNILQQGEVFVFTEKEGAQILRAPLRWISEPRTKRFVYVVQDAVWTTIHPTNKTDLAEIERDIIVPEEFV